MVQIVSKTVSKITVTTLYLSDPVYQGCAFLGVFSGSC